MLISLIFFLLAQQVAPAGGSAEPVPWPVRLGARSLFRSNQIPMVDQVVIVPDVDTYLDEIARWSKAGQWPVLIEHDFLTAMFIRAAVPARVIRREAVDRPSTTRMERLERMLHRAWEAQPGETAVDAMRRNGVPALGLVLTTEESEAFPAAAALAVGRGQAVGILDGSYGGPGTVLSARRSAGLAELIRVRCRETGLVWEGIDDELDVITLCRNLPARIRIDVPLDARIRGSDVRPDDPLAITDALGRHPDGKRFAMIGWINGTAAETAYDAMCSLFLKPSTTLLMNGYPAKGQWLSYVMTEAAEIFERAGFDTTLVEEAGLSGLRARSVGGIDQDLILMNSKGNRDFFDLGSDRGTPNDIPVLSRPAAVSMIHSWSLVDPSNAQTVGGRWREHGAYAYIGSSQEPFLPSFVPPTTFAARLTMLVPFLIAGRWWEGQSPFANPWRLNTLGDPLMTVGPPEVDTKPRVPGNDDQSAVARGQDVRTEAERLMRVLASDPDAAQLVPTLKCLVLLGEDELARQMWIFGTQRGLITSPAASVMLGPLFRLRDRAAFVEAWRNLSSPSQRQRDMLWQLLGSSLAASTDDEILMVLEQEVTGPTPSSYIEILGPHLSRRFGPAAVVQLIERASRRATAGQEKQRLQGLLRRYSRNR